MLAAAARGCIIPPPLQQADGSYALLYGHHQASLSDTGRHIHPPSTSSFSTAATAPLLPSLPPSSRPLQVLGQSPHDHMTTSPLPPASLLRLLLLLLLSPLLLLLASNHPLDGKDIDIDFIALLPSLPPSLLRRAWEPSSFSEVLQVLGLVPPCLPPSLPPSLLV